MFIYGEIISDPKNLIIPFSFIYNSRVMSGENQTQASIHSVLGTLERVGRGLAGAVKYAHGRAVERPKLMNLEVTKLCNAGCDFCDYWQIKHEIRLEDYTPILKRIKPFMVTITGGEPMLRKDLTNIIGQIKRSSVYTYSAMITKGDLLTVEKAEEFFDAGLHQIFISLDFLSDRHDESRAVPGLWKHLSTLIPQIAGLKKGNVGLNTIIMEDNLDQVLDFAYQAKEWGVKVSYSSYSFMKTNNDSHFIDENSGKVERVINKLLDFKKKHKGVVGSTNYYLKKIPEYFTNSGVSDCMAGINMITVTPSGHIKRCSEMPVIAHGTEYYPGIFDKTKCTSCWYSCRGETEAPLNVERIFECIDLGG